MKILLRTALALSLLAVAACATPGPVLTESVSAIRTGVAAAETETQKVFAEVNAGARDDTIERLVRANQGPSEAAFAAVISDDTAARWAAAFDAMDQYLAALQDLVGEGRSGVIAEDLGAIGSTLQSDSFGVKLPAGSAGLFASLGGALVQASAERSAMDIMRRTDGAFVALTSGLADLVAQPVGQSQTGTLRGMIGRHWDNRLTGVENAYRQVAAGSAAERRAVLETYGETIDKREAEFLKMARLREALLAIGETHSAAAEGKSGAVLFWLDQINDRLKQARDEAEGGK